MSYRAGADVSYVDANRRAFFRDLGVDPERVVFTLPTHGSDVLIATPESWGRAFEGASGLPKADIIYLPEPGTFGAFNPADCLIVTIFDERLYRAAHIHAGFAGVEKEVGPVGLACLLDNGSHVEDLRVFFGPCMGNANYLVTEDYLAQYPGWRTWVAPSGNPAKPHRVNYIERAVGQLVATGICYSQMAFDGRDTFTNLSLFSDFRGHQERFCVLAGYKAD